MDCLMSVRPSWVTKKETKEGKIAKDKNRERKGAKISHMSDGYNWIKSQAPSYKYIRMPLYTKNAYILFFTARERGG